MMGIGDIKLLHPAGRGRVGCDQPLRQRTLGYGALRGSAYGEDPDVEMVEQQTKVATSPQKALHS
jgi:hypothetical protein